MHFFHCAIHKIRINLLSCSNTVIKNCHVKKNDQLEENSKRKLEVLTNQSNVLSYLKLSNLLLTRFVNIH